MFHDVGEVCHCGGIINISLLRGLRKREVMIDEQNERLSLLGR